MTRGVAVVEPEPQSRVRGMDRDNADALPRFRMGGRVWTECGPGVLARRLARRAGHRMDHGSVRMR